MGDLAPANAIPAEQEIKTGSALGDLANFSHQKGDIGLITLSKDKILAMLSATSSLSSNFLCLMLGSALAIFLALKSGAVEDGWRRTFWLGFFGSLVIATYYGILTIRQEIQKRRYRNEIDKAPTTPLH